MTGTRQDVETPSHLDASVFCPDGDGDQIHAVRVYTALQREYRSEVRAGPNRASFARVLRAHRRQHALYVSFRGGKNARYA